MRYFRRVVSAVVAIGVGATLLHAQSRGRIEKFEIASTQYGRARRIWVYTPAGYSAKTTYDLIVAFDGADYQETIPLPRMLDSLVAAKKVPPFVAVLVDDSSSVARIGELGNSPRFARFVGDELMPWLHQRWNVTRDPHRTIVTGSSAGGLGAAYVALQRPDLFGNVLSQSGAFWRGFDGSNDPPYEYLARAYAAAPKRDIRFFIDVGELENHATLGGAGPVFIEANRRLRDVLRSKGYEVIYTEVPGGQHWPKTWRERLPGAIAILGNRESGIGAYAARTFRDLFGDMASPYA